MIKRILLALLALLAAGVIVQTPGVAPQALASPTCTGLAATNLTAYQGCIFNSGANCQTHITGPSSNHTTCTYPDGGRDECDTQAVALGLQPSTVTCQSIRP
jgi:hypothetical protein